MRTSGGRSSTVRTKYSVSSVVRTPSSSTSVSRYVSSRVTTISPSSVRDGVEPSASVEPLPSPRSAFATGTVVCTTTRTFVPAGA